MRQYELMMILDPSLAKADMEHLIADIKKDLADAKLKIAKEDVWGSKEMAYKIHGSGEGYYVIYTLDVEEPKNTKLIVTPLNIKKGVWRYMMTLIPDEATKK